jgi:alpha-aminoadipic semialdehyde synthase
LIRRIGIVEEVKNEWERRVPLIPDDLAELLHKLPIDATIQPAQRRIFPDTDYKNVGAVLNKDLSDCDMIFGIKEVKMTDLIPAKVYLCFSHTIKGQSYNMPMLQHLLNINCTLIDYERMADAENRRLIYFSYHAGVAGIIESFWALGQRLEFDKINSPFNKIKQTLYYDDQLAAEDDFNLLGDHIRLQGLSNKITPFVIGITGYGNVSKGVQHMLDFLPITDILPSELLHIDENYSDHAKTVYKVVFKESDMVVPSDGNVQFELQDYYQHPDKYKANFEQYLPYLSLLINASFWDTPYPRHVTKKNLKKLFSQKNTPALRVIGDISCDIDGGIECTVKATDPGNPVFVYDTADNRISDGVTGRGPVIMAVDNLPSELPKDASIYFSSVLKELVPALVAADYSEDFADLNLPDALKKAVITHKGELAPDYRYLQKYL